MKNNKSDPENEKDRYEVGDGFVSRRTPGVNYEFNYSQNGAHKRKSLKTKDRKIARLRAEEFCRLRRTGEEAGVRKRISMSEAKEKFIDSRKVAGRSPKTTTKYGSEIESFIKFVSGRGFRFMDQITPSLVDDYRSRRAKSLWSSTLDNHGIILTSWCKFAKGRGLIARNPLAEFRLESPVRRRHPATTPEQITEILKESTGMFRWIIATLAFTGARANEGLNLRVENVDLTRKVVHIEDSKTAAAKRQLPIHAALVPVLELAIGGRKGGLLFPNPNPPRNEQKRGEPQPWNDRTVLKIFKEIAERLGYQTGTANLGLTVNSLRRYFKTTALNAGVPEPLVNLWVGHSDDSMNFHYYRPTPEDEQTLMARLPFVLPPERVRREK